MEQATAGQIQNQNQRQPQSNRQAVTATGNSQPDDLKGLGMMMQQLLQSMQFQGKALNQVSTDINTKMDNMFTELNTKYDTVSNHIKRIDVQLAQTAESVKRQQGTLPGKSVMNPRVEHCNAADLRCEKSEGKEPEQLSIETALDAEEGTEHSASSKNEDSDRSKKGNSFDTQKIDKLTAKVDQLLKNNQGHVFSMEQATAGQIQNQNQRQPQSNRQAVPATGNSQPDELKGLGMTMQVQAKALNQVSTDINTRMDNMFTELNTKYDTSAMNPRVDHCNATELRCEKPEGKEPKQLSAETVSGAEERTEQPASSEVTSPDEPIEIPPVRVYVPKVPYPIPPKHLMDPISAQQLAEFRKMVKRLPQKISFEHAWDIRPLHMFFKNCRESQKDIKVLFTETLTPSLKVLPKVDDPGNFIFPCSIVGVKFKEALCDYGSSVNLVSKAIVDELGIVDVEPSLSNRQAVPATGNSQPDELKGLGMMMQQLLQSMQFQGKALNQVSTDINTKMDNMFTELNTKYDTVSNHIKRIDVQLAQTAESVKRQQGTLPGKSVMNPRVEHCNAADLRCEKSEGKEPEQLSIETALDAEEGTEHSASSKVIAPDELAETPPVRVYVPKVPYPIPSKHLMDPISAEHLAGFRKMRISGGIKTLFTEALTPSLKKVFYKAAPTISQIRYASCISVVSGEQPNIIPKEFGDKSVIKEVLDGDPHTDTKKLSGNAKVKEKVQKKRVTGDPTMTLIPRLCDEKSIEYEKIDELTVKVDQLLKNNQGHVFSMDQAMVGQIQNQNQRQPQSNRQAVPATGNSQPDELKGLGMMMQQLLQGMKIHGNALNQVSTDINTRMDNMFTELNTKYDTVSNHIKRIDVQLAQTTERVKSQQGDLPGKNVMNPRVEHCNAAELRCEKSEGKEPEQLSVETVPDAEERTEHSTSSK
ncbi:hypothetical protein F2Q70_00002558 [Brassica cretica]|uniref:Retrotransposon gag domain-containing protein n=1 Tax=Brassica cretica TaxID=69181 RepID=A0A8S9IZW4_BRACR|nr:hypothetical protein F2Q70_00002558 [Brassica cretica]